MPYVVLLVRALEEWKQQVGTGAGSREGRGRRGRARLTRGRSQNRGKTPGYDNLDAVKEILGRSRRALDEENFDEAESQAYRAVQPSEVGAGGLGGTG